MAAPVKGQKMGGFEKSPVEDHKGRGEPAPASPTFSSEGLVHASMQKVDRMEARKKEMAILLQSLAALKQGLSQTISFQYHTFAEVLLSNELDIFMEGNPEYTTTSLDEMESIARSLCTFKVSKDSAAYLHISVNYLL